MPARWAYTALIALSCFFSICLWKKSSCMPHLWNHEPMKQKVTPSNFSWGEWPRDMPSFQSLPTSYHVYVRTQNTSGEPKRSSSKTTVSSLVTLQRDRSQPPLNFPFFIVGLFSDFKVRYIYAEKILKRTKDKIKITPTSRDNWM